LPANNKAAAQPAKANICCRRGPANLAANGRDSNRPSTAPTANGAPTCQCMTPARLALTTLPVETRAITASEVETMLAMRRLV
jgi:hypothetical protein